jgi:hypothetical protein
MDDSVDIIRNLLKIQLEIKLYHWRTKSYARHVASGDLYDSLNKDIDLFVEIYQGKFNTINFSQINNINLSSYNDKTITILLEEFKNFLLYELNIFLEKNDMFNCDLKNLRDEILGKVNKTLYLFTLN